MLTESRIMAVVVTHNDTILKKAFWLFTTGLAVGIGCRNVSSVCLMGGLKLLTTVAKVVHVYLIIIGAWLPSSNSHNQSTTWRYCLYQPFIKAADCVSRWPRLVAQLAIVCRYEQRIFRCL
ncbi:putative L-asparaginase [Trichinella pseudospiralis]